MTKKRKTIMEELTAALDKTKYFERHAIWFLGSIGYRALPTDKRRWTKADKKMVARAKRDR